MAPDRWACGGPGRGCGTRALRYLEPLRPLLHDEAERLRHWARAQQADRGGTWWRADTREQTRQAWLYGSGQDSAGIGRMKLVRSYWQTSRSPRYSVLFALPLLL